MPVIPCSSQFARMSSRRKVQMSMMWKGGHRRRSPRISGLNNACKAQPMRRVKVGTTNAADHHRRINGPASRTRARKKRKLGPLQVHDVAATSSVSPISQQSQDVDANDEECGHEHHPSNSDQPSSVPSASWMPEKRVLERIIDILQRRDTNEIFAQPVDSEEVEDYYEIIKEPMDFGTMRAKLHEGMYTSLQQFEHDVFLISGNAMHFNSSATMFFRQARAIHELAKKVFQALKTDPDKFELEFSETRRRSGRRQQNEASGPKLATNLRFNSMGVNVSSKTMPCSLSGSSNFRRSRGNPGCSSAATPVSARDRAKLSGSKNGRKNSYVEVDRRCTYIPWTSFLNEKNDTMSSTIYNNSKTLVPVNQQDIGYKESLMLFVRDLGPTAHTIAKRKLQGWSADAFNFQTPKCQIVPAFTTMSCGLQSMTNDEKKKIPIGLRWEDYCSSKEGSNNNGGAELKDAGSKALEHCTKHSWRNNPSSSSAWPLQRIRTSRDDDDQALVAASSGKSQPIVSQFTFDLPYLKTRLDQINVSRRLGLDRDRLVQCTTSTGVENPDTQKGLVVVSEY